MTGAEIDEMVRLARSVLTNKPENPSSYVEASRVLAAFVLRAFCPERLEALDSLVRIAEQAAELKRENDQLRFDRERDRESIERLHSERERVVEATELIAADIVRERSVFEGTG